MRKKWFVLMLVLICMSLYAEYVPFEDAQIIAENWTVHLRENFNDHVRVTSGESIEKEGVVVAHVFRFFPEGYVVVSARDYLPPIKMYSLKNNFGGTGRIVEDMVFRQYKEIIQHMEINKLDPDAVFSPRNKTMFKRLKRQGHLRSPNSVSPPSILPHSVPAENRPRTSPSEVVPFVATTWNQMEPYNLFCPMWEDKRSATGCTATAVAQVMNYYKYPAVGTGSRDYHTATHNIPVSVSFEHPYQWDLMLDGYPTPETGTLQQREAVARLMLDVGAALDMDYSPDGSGAGFEQVIMALPAYFNYSTELTHLYRYGWTDAQWFQLAKKQVDHRLPSIWALFDPEGGHAVVIDGYRISDAAETFHMNLGWEGNWDGYYNLNNVVTKYHFNITDYQNCLINIAPSDSEIPFPTLPVGGAGHADRSLFMQAYVCNLTWQTYSAHTVGSSYAFAIYNNKTKERTWLENTIHHIGPNAPYTATLRLPGFDPAHSLVAVYVYHEFMNTGYSEWLPLMTCYLKPN